MEHPPTPFTRGIWTDVFRSFAIALDDNWQGGEKETSIPPFSIQQEMDELAATLGPHKVDFGHDHAVLEGALVRASLG